MTEVQIIARV